MLGVARVIRHSEPTTGSNSTTVEHRISRTFTCASALARVKLPKRSLLRFVTQYSSHQMYRQQQQSSGGNQALGFLLQKLNFVCV